MEDAGVITSSTKDRDGAGNDNADGSSPLVQLQVYEPRTLCLKVCTTPLTMLRRTTIAELRVNESTVGFYLLIRSLGPIFRGTIYKDFGQNVTVLVEDHAKNRSSCCLHGHVHLKSERELVDLLPLNTVFVLKEPVLVASSEQNTTIVVGSPSDFVVVGRSHVLYEDAVTLGWRENTVDEGVQLTMKWKKIGDDFFKKRKHHEACDAYLFALNNGGDDETNLLLNVNLAGYFLAQDCYETSIKHAFNALKVRPSNERALYFAGRAFYELGQYGEAKFYFERLACALPTDEHVLEELGRCERRLSEAEGNVDIDKLFRACLSARIPTEVGTFVGDLEFRISPGEERGIFATKDLEPGTLILVEKSVAEIFEPRQSSSRGVAEFVRTVLEKVLKNPEVLGYALYCFPGGGIQTGEKRTYCDEDRQLEPIVDVRRFYQIIRKNIIKTSNTLARCPSFTYQLFRLGSRFRHSCLSNCTVVVYKNVITVRTCFPVQKGDELYVRYCGNHLTIREKQKAFEHSGLTCSCFLCRLDKMEIPELHDLREHLRSAFYSKIRLHLDFSSHAEENFLQIVKELELSYKTRQSLRLVLFYVYYVLAKVLDPTREDWKFKVTLYVEKGLRSVGLSRASLLSSVEQVNPQIPVNVLSPEVLFEYAGLMAEVEYSSGRLDVLKKWVKVILLLERIYRGGNLEMLKYRFVSFRKVPSILSEFAK